MMVMNTVKVQDGWSAVILSVSVKMLSMVTTDVLTCTFFKYCYITVFMLTHLPEALDK